jgi:LPPG:FO 2-phospho-L-lactate transferase
MTTVTVIAGGVGAARFLRGLLQVVDPADVTAIVNTGDDIELHGLAISPDLDTVTYTLADAINAETGWGLTGESWNAMDALARYGPVRPTESSAANTWFNLGDRDLATHLYRTHRRREGATLSTVTAEITAAWGLGLRVLPMSDDRVETRVHTDHGEMGFQEYFVGHHHNIAVRGVHFAGIDEARPAPGVLEAIANSDVVVIAPSNPIVSIGPVVALPGVLEALHARRARTVAVSPIVAGAALKGPADRMLDELGHEPSVRGVAQLYWPLISTIVIDEADREHCERIEGLGIVPVVTDTIMSRPGVAAELARITIASVL